MADGSSGLASLELVNPQDGRGATLGRAFRNVPAGAADELPGESGELAVDLAGAGRMFTLEEWNAVTHGTSLVVLVRGRVVHEWYAEGLGPREVFLGASMTKSALAHLVGIGVRSGALSLTDRVSEHVPELARGGYATCTVHDLLTMTTGVDWVEDHRDPASLASRLVACFGGGGGESRVLLGEVGPRASPGTRYEYCTADSQVLDWVRERATGAPYDVALGELWRPLGCTSDAFVGTDSAGVCMAGGSLAATARDWARIGLLQLDGTVAGTRLLDQDWVERSTRAAYAFTEPGRLPSTITTHAGFGYHWWPTDRTGRRATADGSRGQFTYVDRDLDVVVVKTSRWPYADAWLDRHLRDLSYLGLAAVARAAGGG
ncbi:MAG: putative 6-aminohexanoate-dimer hydrolase [Marmoricola sp.]|nr:putative 6-aminohexanoate-dimer hydrolase [Marmoricola sp.]